jgi:hypothetical protein
MKVQHAVRVTPRYDVDQREILMGTAREFENAPRGASTVVAVQRKKKNPPNPLNPPNLVQPSVIDV